MESGNVARKSKSVFASTDEEFPTRRLEPDPFICENLNVVSRTETMVVSWTVYLLLPGISLLPTDVGLWLHPLKETTKEKNHDE